MCVTKKKLRVRLGSHLRGFGPHGWVNEWCAVTAPIENRVNAWKASLMEYFLNVMLYKCNILAVNTYGIMTAEHVIREISTFLDKAKYIQYL